MFVIKSLQPYGVARYRAFERRHPGALHVIAIGGRESIRAWKVGTRSLGFRFSELFSNKDADDISGWAVYLALRRRFGRLKPKVVVITGYSPRMMRIAASAARRNGAPVVMVCEASLSDRPRRWLLERTKQWWVQRNVAAVFAGGKRAVAYGVSLGVPRNRIWTGYDVVDNDFFDLGQSNGWAVAGSRRGGGGSFLYVGRFAAEKNLALLLAAYRAYRRKTMGKPWSLRLVGDGPEHKKLVACVKNDCIEGVEFAGFKQMAALKAEYSRATCLVHPSLSEPWGLVVNEALACGLPVLVSDRCGCAPDLVRDGRNGYTFDPQNVKELTGLMLRITSDRRSLAGMGAWSRRIVRPWNPDSWAVNLAACVRAAVGQQHSKANT